MTLERDPLTTEDVLRRVISALTIERAAEVVGKTTSYVHKLSHPAHRYRLTLDHAEALDLAYAAEVEPGRYPLFESYRLRLEAAASISVRDAIELGRHAAQCVREGGEGCAALIEASLPGASDAQLRHAITQLEESCGADTGAIGALQEVLRRRGGPDPPA